ncbi:MAG: peptidylprolyl isomerase [Saprospiraceae bacterium]
MIRNRVFLVLALLLSWALSANAQKENQKDPVLFTVNGVPVTVSEFTYIYTKTNGPRATFSRASLEEYLDLYQRFKLKVQKAKDMKLDTIPSLREELEGYRRQLADSYLIDKEVTERLVEEAYKHSQQDVNISHILVSIPGDGRDTMRAYQRITEAKSMLMMGEAFDSIAVRYSDDKSAKSNYGHVGYVTAIFPKGLYKLEKAAYSAPTGQIVGPLRTVAGYHLLVVHDRRAARGEVECAHILIRKPIQTGEFKDAKGRIDSIYQALQAGANFEELAKTLSEDRQSATKGGYIGVFGINRYERSFEDAAFGIEKEGGYSQPFETTAGWHIIKLISKRPIGAYNTAKAGLMTKVKNDDRFEEAKQAMIEKVKKENDFKEFNTTLENFTDTLTESILSYKWKAPQPLPQTLLFSFGAKSKATLGDFMDYLERSSRKRIRMANQYSPKEAVMSLYKDFINEQTLKFEEQQLDVKYPEFKALMREYEEGILLFEATKIVVWDKAAQDSTGLEEFFKTIEGKYKWEERGVLSVYSLKSLDKDLLDKVQKYAAKNSSEEVLKKFNTDPANPILVRSERNVEKGRSKLVENIAWQAGSIAAPEVNERDQTQNFVKIEEILPPANKTLEEARGYVIADYQDFLEKQWVNHLRQQYPIKVNEEVFRSLIK